MGNTVALGTLITQAKNVRCGDNKYPVLSMTMHNGLVFQDEKFKKVIASKDTSDYKVVYRNQLVISFPIDEGVLAAQRIADAGIVSPAYGIWDIDEAMVLPEFLEYALRCDRAIQYYKANLRGSTARRRSLPTPTLLSFTVPLPPLEEQEEILDRIHKVSSITEKRKMQLRALDDLIKARFVEMFGEQFKGSLIKVGDLADVYIGLTYKPENVSEEGTIVLRSGNIQNQSLQVETDVVRVSGVKIAENKYVKDKDILMCARNGSARLVGKSCLIRNPKEEMAFGAFMSVIRTECPYFLQGFFSSDYFKNQLTNVGTTSVNQITSKMLNEYSVILPTKKQEEEFSVFCDQVDKSKVV